MLFSLSTNGSVTCFERSCVVFTGFLCFRPCSFRFRFPVSLLLWTCLIPFTVWHAVYYMHSPMILPP